LNLLVYTAIQIGNDRFDASYLATETSPHRFGRGYFGLVNNSISSRHLEWSVTRQKLFALISDLQLEVPALIAHQDVAEFVPGDLPAID
jgi:hypothetical protein